MVSIHTHVLKLYVLKMLARVSKGSLRCYQQSDDVARRASEMEVHVSTKLVQLFHASPNEIMR